MTKISGRKRVTIASLMSLIAALALLMAFGLPILRHGAPPCLSTMATAQWLVSKPGTANCTQCHARAEPGKLAFAVSLFTPTTKPAMCRLEEGRDPKSCVACHGK